MKNKIIAAFLWVNVFGTMITGCGSNTELKESKVEESILTETEQENEEKEKEFQTEIEIVEQEITVPSDDKTINIEGNQITFEKTTVEEILAMFPDKEYSPDKICLYEDNNEPYNYNFRLMDENISISFLVSDYEARARANERGCHSSNDITLKGKEPEIDVSNFKLARILIYNTYLQDEISDIKTISDNENFNIGEKVKNSVVLYKGIKMGMTEEEFLEIYPDACTAQEISYYTCYYVKNLVNGMVYYLGFLNNASKYSELENTEKRLYQMDIVIDKY